MYAAGGMAPMTGGNPEMPSKVFDLFKSLDPRLRPGASAFCAQIGAQSISYVPQKINQKNQVTHVFPVTPPSPGVVMQLDIVWNLIASLPFTMQRKRSMPAGTLFPRYGIDYCVAAASPLNQLVQSWSITINNANTTFINTGLRDLLYLIDTPTSRGGKGVTYRKPMYVCWDDAYCTTYGLGGVQDLQGEGDCPPGAYQVTQLVPPGMYAYTQSVVNGPWVQGQAINSQMDNPMSTVAFTQSAPQNIAGLAYGPPNVALAPYLLTGVTLPTAGTYGTTMQYTGQTYVVAAAPIDVDDPICLYAIQVNLIDVVQCPPFGWSSDEGLREQGIWGINNMLIVAQLGDPSSEETRWLQGCTNGGALDLQVQQGQWRTNDSTMWFTYLSPAQNKMQLLPPRCVLPYLYKQTTQYADPDALAPSTMRQGLNVPSYTFSTVASSLLISVRPLAPDLQSSRPFNECDYIAPSPDQAFSQFQYSNMSGLMANMTRQKLLAICRHNGITVSIPQAGGLVGGGGLGYTGAMMCNGFKTGMGGHPIVLTPGIDFQLPEGTAGGTSGNIQLQYAINFLNPSVYTRKFQVTTTNVSTGFFVVDNGAARIMLAGLDEEAITAAPVGADSYSAAHLVGGGSGWYQRLSNLFGKVMRHKDHFKNVYNSGKDAIQNPTADTVGKAFGAAKGAYDAWRGDSGGGVAGTKRMRGSLSEALSRC